jgi:hypothetical protein
MYRTSFSDAEWSTVLFTPLWAFYAVAGIDKKIDDKEASALSKELVEAGLYKDEFTREVLGAIASDFVANMEAYNADRRDILKGLMEAGQLLDAKIGAKADDFKRTCLGIAVNAAKASGPIIGDKVSKDEKKALVLVAAALRVPLQA